MAPASFVGSFKISEKKVVIRLKNQICDSAEELLRSDLCHEIIKRAIASLQRRHSILLRIFGSKEINESNIRILIQTFEFLEKMPMELVGRVVQGAEEYLRDKNLLNDFVEFLYNYWRSFDRFIICDSEGDQLDKRPFRTFTNTIEDLTALVRKTYREIQENITGTHPRIYRQVAAGAEMAAIALPKEIPYPTDLYRKLNAIPVIRQVLFYPPLVLNQLNNTREGKFERVQENPLARFDLNRDEWLCYPVKTGDLRIFVYFKEKFFEMGLSLCNLFEMASDEDLKRQPDAVYVYGAPEKALEYPGVFPTVFYDDQENGLLIGAVPESDRFGYFGYLKKMILTLHNIKRIKTGRMPFHGAFMKLYLKGKKPATLLLMGDTGAGKSETLEAMRGFGAELIQDVVVVADDMGSLELRPDGNIAGYGTETGAFLRLDDLKPGYALGQIDRAIIMSPSQTNARIALPVTTFDNIIQGHTVDFVLYANNYEDIDEDHPIIEKFKHPEEAIKVFREGAVMSKGTTKTTGLVHTYFSNVFGAIQYKNEHDVLAKKFFEAFFNKGIFVGQMRTRLGVPGWERKGPEESAKELLETIKSDPRF
ncbi:MAG TPA: phosphoenolpyruvate carboxykinase [Candidatus Omnitrophota bacterium]|nr:phosphoenolpyruvate carboxykinase [Candidatus Omnitrophota bacterium]